MKHAPDPAIAVPTVPRRARRDKQRARSDLLYVLELLPRPRRRGSRCVWRGHGRWRALANERRQVRALFGARKRSGRGRHAPTRHRGERCERAGTCRPFPSNLLVADAQLGPLAPTSAARSARRVPCVRGGQIKAFGRQDLDGARRPGRPRLLRLARSGGARGEQYEIRVRARSEEEQSRSPARDQHHPGRRWRSLRRHAWRGRWAGRRRGRWRSIGRPR